MALWTDVITPAELTGYARAALEDYEQSRGTLARFLPNRDVADVVVRFVAGQSGLVEAANFRAYDAEIEIGTRPKIKRVTLELPALGQNLPVSEYEQIRARSGNVSDEAALVSIQNTTRLAVQSVSDAIERLRGIVLATGVATIDQDNFQSADNFGRSESHTVTSPTLWSDTSFDRLTYIEGLCDIYRDDNGEDPGAILMSTRVLRALQAGDSLQTQLVNGGARQPTLEEVNSFVEGAGLPPIVRYDRRVRRNGTTKRALPDNVFIILPAPVATDDWEGTDLGATFWGRTLSASDAGWGIEEADQPGVVAGVYRDEKPPMGIEVISDAIGLPVLANADLTIASTVLAA
jgi:Phage major capsid protein E